MATQNHHQFHSTFFPPHFRSHGARVPVLPWKKENVPRIKQCSLGCRLPCVCVQNGKQQQTPHCGLTIHPKNKTAVEAGTVVHVDLYISKQPNYYPFISFSPLNDNPHTHSGGNSKHQFSLHRWGISSTFRVVCKPQSAWVAFLKA